MPAATASPPARAPVDPKTCEFRAVRLASPRDLHAELDRVVAADRAGTLRQCGNWTAGTTFGHLATFIEYAYDGYPPDLASPPWFIRAILKLSKGRFMRGPLPRGVRIPKIEGGTKGTEPMTTEAGLARLKAAWARLEASPPPRPNPIFGPLTHQEWITMHLRHAELHLGYLQP
jgi:hypothetical protein